MRRSTRRSGTNHGTFRDRSAARFEPLEDRRLLAALFRDGEILVQFTPTADVAARDAVHGALKGRAAETIHTPAMRGRGEGAVERVTIGNGMTIDQAVKAVAGPPLVAGHQAGTDPVR